MNESYGTVAETYAACPDAGREFVLDRPERTQSDTGQARLRLVA